MRVLQVASHRNITRGGAVQMVRLARSLREMGAEVDLVFNGSEDPLPSEIACLREEGFAVRLFEMERPTPRGLLEFRKFVLSNAYQVIHAHRDPALRFSFLSLAGTPIPLVAQRGTTYRPKGLAKLVLKSPRVQLVVGVSHAVRDALLGHGVSPGKVRVVYGSADAGEFTHRGVRGEMRSSLGLQQDSIVVGMVAALVGKKGYPHFLNAVGRLSRRVAILRALCVGRGRPEKFREFWEPIAGQVVFTGHREDVARCMEAMDLLVCASTKGEGLTGAMREAMLMGVPVVSTAVSGNPEVVLHGHTGLLVPIGDEDALVRAIGVLVECPALGARFARQARVLARNLFTHKLRAQKVLNLYRELAV